MPPMLRDDGVCWMEDATGRGGGVDSVTAW